MTPVTVRSGRDSDASEAVKLVVMAIEDLAHQFTQSDSDEQLYTRMAQLFTADGTRFSKAFAVVIEDGGAVAAVGFAYPAKDMKTLTEGTLSEMEKLGIVYEAAEKERLLSSKEAFEDEYYIDNLAVFEVFRGKGYAKIMLEAFEKNGLEQGYKKIAILADVNNPKAQAIYEKMGYVADCQLPVLGHTYNHLVKGLSK